jgi:hypothetical protein
VGQFEFERFRCSTALSAAFARSPGLRRAVSSRTPVFGSEAQARRGEGWGEGDLERRTPLAFRIKIPTSSGSRRRGANRPGEHVLQRLSLHSCRRGGLSSANDVESGSCRQRRAFQKQKPFTRPRGRRHGFPYSSRSNPSTRLATHVVSLCFRHEPMGCIRSKVGFASRSPLSPPFPAGSVERGRFRLGRRGGFCRKH